MTNIRVMTFNLFNTVPDDQVEHFSDIWANRAAFNVKTIKRYDPDVIGFQEFEPVHWATYRKELADYGHSRHVEHETGETTAIFWKSERFDALDDGYFWLPRAEVPQAAHLEDDPLMNTTWAKLRCRSNGLEFIHLNTHLNDESEAARQAGNQLNQTLVFANLGVQRRAQRVRRPVQGESRAADGRFWNSFREVAQDGADRPKELWLIRGAADQPCVLDWCPTSR